MAVSTPAVSDADGGLRSARLLLSASHCPSHTPGTFYHKPIVLSPLKKLHRNRILGGMHLGGNQSMVDE